MAEGAPSAVAGHSSLMPRRRLRARRAIRPGLAHPALRALHAAVSARVRQRLLPRTATTTGLSRDQARPTHTPPRFAIPQQRRTALQAAREAHDGSVGDKSDAKSRKVARGGGGWVVFEWAAVRKDPGVGLAWSAVVAALGVAASSSPRLRGCCGGCLYLAWPGLRLLGGVHGPWSDGL